MGALIARAFFKSKAERNIESMYSSLLEIKATDINGKEQYLREILSGMKCVMVVNVASKCSFSKRTYKEMVSIHNKYSQYGLEILAFPCNQFMKQEPGSDE